jgi:hypothetical protein
MDGRSGGRHETNGIRRRSLCALGGRLFDGDWRSAQIAVSLYSKRKRGRKDETNWFGTGTG